MGKSVGPYANRGPIEYTSLASPVDFSPPIVWIHIDSAGSGGLTVITEDGISHSYTSLPTGRVLVGPFKELTSMTCSKISVGDGRPPTSTLANVAPASTGALGSVKTSVAPLNGASPIAVENTDARVNTIDFPIGLSGTDGSLVESIAWRAPYNCTVTGAFITSSVAMAASNTDYDTFTVQNRPLAGPGTPAVIIATTTKAADLNALVAFTEKSLATVALANTAMLAGDLVCFKSVASGAGKASGPGLLRVTYSVP